MVGEGKECEKKDLKTVKQDLHSGLDLGLLKAMSEYPFSGCMWKSL